MIVITHILLVFIVLMPKISIISINNSVTGIRAEDFLVLICTLLLLLINKKKVNSNKIKANSLKIEKVMY